MQRNRPPSPQAINVLRALAADPAQWRYGYDLATEVHLKSGSLYPILVRLADRGLLRTLSLMLPCAAYTGPWNACGFPAMNLPVGTTQSGLPVGVQLIGPALSEATLLAVAASIEGAADWLDRRVDKPPEATRLP